MLAHRQFGKRRYSLGLPFLASCRRLRATVDKNRAPAPSSEEGSAFADVDEYEEGGQAAPVSSVGSTFLRWSVAVRVMVLVGFVFASRASAQMHGYVEPCAVPFVQDSKTTCEECPFHHSDPKACARTLGDRGYTFECRTKGHSAPAEVWCRPREGENALPRPLLLAAVVGGVALFVAGFLWWKRKPAA